MVHPEKSVLEFVTRLTYNIYSLFNNTDDLEEVKETIAEIDNSLNQKLNRESQD